MLNLFVNSVSIHRTTGPRKGFAMNGTRVVPEVPSRAKYLAAVFLPLVCAMLVAWRLGWLQSMTAHSNAFELCQRVMSDRRFGTTDCMPWSNAVGYVAQVSGLVCISALAMTACCGLIHTIRGLRGMSPDRVWRGLALAGICLSVASGCVVGLTLTI